MSPAGHSTVCRLVVVVLLTLAGCSPEGSTATSTTVAGLEIPTEADLLVVGDWGSGNDSQAEVAATMERVAEDLQPAAILTTGDNLYSDNWEALLEPFAWATEEAIPFLVSWGNHDVESERRIQMVDEAFDDPPRWALHEWGDVDIVILDSNQVGSDAQLDFLAATLGGSDDPTIVVFHHPPYSCGAHGNTPGMDAWVDAFDDDVFLVLSGHEHNYQRFESDGVAYVVTGGGGRSLTDLAQCSETHPSRLAGEATHNFVTLEQGAGVIGTAYDADGNIIDRFEVPLP